MYSSDEYDSYSDSEFSYENEAIDNISIDDIIDVYEEFRERFSLMPFFLSKLKSSDLTDITYECIYDNSDYYNNNIEVNSRLYNKFIDEYKDIIYISYKLYNNFINNYNSSIDLYTWGLICYNYSDNSCL